MQRREPQTLRPRKKLEARTPPQGTLNGEVVAGPTCPVESPDLPCPPKPVPDLQVRIETLDGKLVTTTTADKNGISL